MLRRIILDLHYKLEEPTKINVHQAVDTLMDAWWNVTSGVLRNCWQKAGFNRDADAVQDSAATDRNAELQESIQSFCAETSAATVNTSEVYDSADDEVFVCYEWTTDGIVEAIEEVKHLPRMTWQRATKNLRRSQE